jgi:hypothetical protein
LKRIQQRLRQSRAVCNVTRIGFAVLAVCALSAGLPREVLAQVGDLMVTPTRVVLEGRERTAEVTVINQGTKPATYRISFRHMRMTDMGQLEDVTDSALEGMYADDFIRYSPRQVLLQPGEAQLVRLLVRKPPDLKPGEYRSHLLFRAVPDRNAGADIEPVVREDGISVRLIPVFGISIPVIVRHGDLTVTAELSDLALDPHAGPDHPPSLKLTLERAGDLSLYGDMIAEFERAGKTVEVGLVRGIAVYTSMSRRSVQFRLNPPDGLSLTGGKLRVKYHASDNREDVLAEAEVYIP